MLVQLIDQILLQMRSPRTELRQPRDGVYCYPLAVTGQHTGFLILRVTKRPD